LILALSLLLVLVVAAIDWKAMEGIARSYFYVVPICVATWYGGRRFGLCVAVVCSALRFVAHATGTVAAVYGPVVEAVNVSLGLVVYCTVVLLLAKVKTDSDDLEKKVEERTAALLGEIAERKRAEEERRSLAHQLSEAEERERTRLAADIHDSVGQGLSVLKLNLGVLANRNGDNGQPSADWVTSLRLIDEIVNQIRTFTFEIHPAMLEDLGLVPTLHWYGEQFESQSGTQVTVSEYGQRRPLSATLATCLFRAIKELLNNAAKHGRAKEVVIGVHWREDGLRIVLDDDGSGFNPADALAPQTRRGLGLAGMQERLLAIKGRLTVESEPGHGARIILEMSY